MNVSGGFRRLTGELEFNLSFEDTQFKGTCYLGKHPKLDLIGLDWIEKFGLLDFLANSNQLATKLMSTILPPAEVNKKEKKEEELGEKAPAASEPRQIPGQSTRSGTCKRRGAPTKFPSSSPTNAADSPDLSTRHPGSKKARTLASTRPSRKRVRAVPSQARCPKVVTSQTNFTMLSFPGAPPPRLDLAAAPG
ncbi:unnamed protein product [Dibothriocephalus latus]|uniref:Uncharacterized protein n=1 Tax=Dibothriocephalus latus TaxID=60516 RepID=A0A3P7LEJ4_DIBLA|nr:unnamed protein product [Dibothriocephalus latus]